MHIVPAALLLLFVGVAIAGIFWLRKKFGAGDESQSFKNKVFTLSQIKEMHQTGQITQLEYETLRDQIIHQTLKP